MADKATDPELLAMSRLNRQLEALDPEARRRVLEYLAARHLPETVTPPAATDRRCGHPGFGAVMAPIGGGEAPSF